jgi:hypothetical protein
MKTGHLAILGAKTAELKAAPRFNGRRGHDWRKAMTDDERWDQILENARNEAERQTKEVDGCFQWPLLVKYLKKHYKPPEKKPLTLLEAASFVATQMRLAMESPGHPTQWMEISYGELSEAVARERSKEDA